MQRFVVFLRAINVGGHSVKRETLIAAFSVLGFQGVSTFRQSGNVIFKTETSNPAAVQEQVKLILGQTLNFNVDAFIRTIQQLKDIVTKNPFEGQLEKNVDFQVTFLSRPVDFPFKLPLRIPNSTADVICVRGAEVYSVTRGHGGGGRPNPFIESSLKTRATTRNWNIIRAIVDRYDEN